MARSPQQGPIHLGLDVHRNTIAVATLPPDRASADVERIPGDEAAVLSFLGRFADPAQLRVCYEAGPTGYELARLLHSHGVACQVIAPSLIPRAAGDKARDRPARLPARWPGWTAPASWSPSPSPPWGGGGPGSVPRPGRPGRVTAARPVGGCRPSCSGTAASTGPGPAGPASTSAG
jgi:hypothetical protein